MDSLNLWCWGRDSQGLALEVILDQKSLDQDGGENCLVLEVLGLVFHGEKNPWDLPLASCVTWASGLSSLSSCFSSLKWGERIQ